MTFSLEKFEHAAKHGQAWASMGKPGARPIKFLEIEYLVDAALAKFSRVG